MSGQNQTWKMGPISASQSLNGQWSGHIQSWGLGDRSIENQLTHTRPEVTMAIDRNKSCVCRYFIDDVFEMIHCLTHSIHLFLNLNLNSEWGVELKPDNHFSFRHVIGPGALFPHSHWFSLTASDQTEWHDIMGTGLLAISVLTESERRGTLSWMPGGWGHDEDLRRLWLPGTISPASCFQLLLILYFVPGVWYNLVRSGHCPCTGWHNARSVLAPQVTDVSPGADQVTVCCPSVCCPLLPSHKSIFLSPGAW